jgi:hypothetical protein
MHRVLCFGCGNSHKTLPYSSFASFCPVLSAARQKAQLIHNQELKGVDTESIGADEFWSFVETSRNIATTKS